MATKRKRHPAAFKAQVALEAAKQSKSVAELANTDYGKSLPVADRVEGGGCQI